MLILQKKACKFTENCLQTMCKMALLKAFLAVVIRNKGLGAVIVLYSKVDNEVMLEDTTNSML